MLLGPRGHGDDRQVRLKGREMLQRFPAVSTARVQIDKDDVDPLLANLAQSFESICGGNDLVILDRERLAKCLANHCVVVD